MGQRWRNFEELEAERPANEANVARHMARMLAEVRAYRLAELRKEQHLSQQDVAEAMSVSQSRVSRIEHGEIGRAEIDTIRAYVEALGGKFEGVAIFGDERLVIA